MAAVVDADLTPFAGVRLMKLIDMATIQAAYDTLGQLAQVDWKLRGDEQKDGQLAEQLQALIGVLEERARKPYGPGMTGVSVGMPGVANVMPNDPLAGPYSRTCGWPYPGWPNRGNP